MSDITNAALGLVAKKLDDLVRLLSDTPRRLEQIKDAIQSQTATIQTQTGAIQTQTGDLARAFPNEKDINKLSDAAKALQSATEMQQSKEELGALITTLQAVGNSHREDAAQSAANYQQLAGTISGLSPLLRDIISASSDTSDTKIITSALQRVETAIGAIPQPDATEIEPVVTELKGVQSLITDLTKAVRSQNTNALETKIDALATAVGSISFSAPSKISLDDAQFKTLAQAGRGGSAVSSLSMATRISNTTVTAASTSVEYTYTFPTGTVGWVIKLRDQGTLAYYSWIIGKLPSSGTGTTYMTIPQNYLRSQQEVEYGGKTIYLGVENASQTFEIEVFLR